MDFTEQAKALLPKLMSYGHWRETGLNSLAAALQAAYEAGQNEAPTAEYLRMYSEAVIKANVPLIAEALACKGIVDCTGEKAVVRKVLGTLPVTADGCVAEYGRTYWVHIKQPVIGTANGPFVIERWNTIIAEECLESCEPCEDYEGSWNTDPSVCYSTREAAEAGRKAK